MIRLSGQTAQIEVLDQTSQSTFKGLESIGLLRVELGLLSRCNRPFRSSVNVRAVGDVPMQMARSVVARQRQRRASKRKIGDSTRKVVVVVEVLTLVNQKAVFVALLSDGAKTALTVPGLVPWLVQPACSSSGYPLRHRPKRIEFLVGVGPSVHAFSSSLPLRLLSGSASSLFVAGTNCRTIRLNSSSSFAAKSSSMA